MNKDEFFKAFPHFFSVPERPQCSHCLWVPHYQMTDQNGLELIEHHSEKCPLALRNNLATPLGVPVPLAVK